MGISYGLTKNVRARIVQEAEGGKFQGKNGSYVMAIPTGPDKLVTLRPIDERPDEIQEIRVT